MADPNALSEGLRQSQARPKITDEEETTLCPPDRAIGASQSVSEIQSPNETPLGSRCEDRHDLQAGIGTPLGFGMLKVSMIMSLKLQDRGVSFLPEGKSNTSKEDRPLAKVGPAPALTRSFRRKRPIPPAPGSQEKHEVMHKIILDQLKEEQEAASRSSTAPLKDEQETTHQAHREQYNEQARPVPRARPTQVEEEEEQMPKAPAPTMEEQAPPVPRAKTSQVDKEEEEQMPKAAAPTMEEQAPPVPRAKTTQVEEEDEEQMPKAAAPTVKVSAAAAALDDKLRAKACTTLTRSGSEEALVQVLQARCQQETSVEDEHETTWKASPEQRKDEQETTQKASPTQHRDDQDEQDSIQKASPKEQNDDQDEQDTTRKASPKQHEAVQETTQKASPKQHKDEQETIQKASLNQHRDDEQDERETIHQASLEQHREQYMKYRTTNDQLKEISDRNEISGWLHDDNNSKGDETMDLLQCSMQKANSSVGGFLYRHELLGLFPCLDGNTWNAEMTEELLAKSGLEFSKDGKIEMATFFHWLVQAASS